MLWGVQGVSPANKKKIGLGEGGPLQNKWERRVLGTKGVSTLQKEYLMSFRGVLGILLQKKVKNYETN